MEIVDGKPYLDHVKNLIVEYTERLVRGLAFQNIDDELKNISRKYAGQEGALLVAIDGEGNVGGMIAYHRHSGDRCEMKHLYSEARIQRRKTGRTAHQGNLGMGTAARLQRDAPHLCGPRSICIKSLGLPNARRIMTIRWTT